ncbi:tRNA 2-thiocytidine(32) synthetase TtcA [Psittacicella hinzii]|uniref:tRNA-cytidine(32) 2-sulfurtransferase n=1 Tax=Psittacicella hinzii TaxID=2028575 RepID=A0A3A1Y2Z2_9GAMM|nr:tRNA 2-thiocytidine(32) synthetase TtcA [Psittacicella hinzii]RIY32692.1 tRNA 2-thiocytidine(32) synthetase TtcA [Psittacicella hinzii]
MQENYRLNKLSKRLRSEVGKAIADFNMIEEGDKIMVCLSGGKDSYALLDILRSLQKYAPVNFELLAVNLDQEQPGFPKEVLPNYLESIGVPYRIVNEDTYSVVKRVIAEGKTTCSLCSRLRRGILYRVAQEEKCTKIALGHHRDDMVETLFLNMFFAGKLKTMPPKLVSDNGLHTVIRPLAYCREKDIEKFAKLKEFPIIPCNLCGSQPNLQRAMVKQMLQSWDKQFPGRIETIFRSMQDVSRSHLLDHRLYDFASLSSLSQQEFNPHHNPNAKAVNVLASKPANAEQDNAEQVVASTAEQVETTLAGQAPQNIAPATLLAKEQAQGSKQEFTEEELDKLATDELFGGEDYDALARQIHEEHTKQEQEELAIKGLNVKQL